MEGHRFPARLGPYQTRPDLIGRKKQAAHFPRVVSLFAIWEHDPAGGRAPRHEVISRLYCHLCVGIEISSEKRQTRSALAAAGAAEEAALLTGNASLAKNHLYINICCKQTRFIPIKLA